MARRIFTMLGAAGQVARTEGLGLLLRKLRHRLDHRVRSWDDAAYVQWLKQHRAEMAGPEVLPQGRVSFGFIMFGESDDDLATVEESLRSLLSQEWTAWTLSLYTSAESPLPSLYPDERITFRVWSGGENETFLNEFLAATPADFVGLLYPGDELEPWALRRLAILAETEQPAVMYTDEDSKEGNRVTQPRFKPDWSPDMFLSSFYTGRAVFFSTPAVRQLGGFRLGTCPCVEDDLLLRLMAKPTTIGHLAGIAYHSAIRHQDLSTCRRELLTQHFAGTLVTIEEGLVPGTFRLDRGYHGDDWVSIIIPVRDKVELLQRLLTSIRLRTTYENYEIIIIDNRSRSVEMLAYLQLVAKPGVIILKYDKDFNYSEMNNLAARVARGKYLVFLNNDTEILSDDWLKSMMSEAQRPEVGAVGAKLLYPNDTVQHAGIILGPWGLAEHSHRSFPNGATGYLSSLKIVRNYSAVTAACLMIKKSTFNDIGGFDAVNLKVAYNDVDLCLRLREKGYLIVFSPYTVLRHYEYATRYFARNLSEVEYMKSRWGQVIEHDPYYNPFLTRERSDFTGRYSLN